MTTQPSTQQRASEPVENAPTLVDLHDVFKLYREQDIETVALRGVSLTIRRGEYVAIVGRSGSGKSTLMGLAAALISPSAGKVVIDGQDLSKADEAMRAQLRRERLGIVFQQANLVPFLTAQENVQLAIETGTAAEKPQRARALLTQVGLGQRLHHKPAKLSGGEQQRVAIAIAIAHDPILLLADELTGELDTATANSIMDLLETLNRERGMAIVLVTHNPAIAARANRMVYIADGALVARDVVDNGSAELANRSSRLAIRNATVNKSDVVADRVVIRAANVARTYPGGVQALRGVNLRVKAGESLAIVGPSGCGKTTLLNLLGGLDRLSEGEIEIAGRSLRAISEHELVQVRRQIIGYIFQSHNLLPTLTAMENVAMPLVLNNVAAPEREARAAAVLALVGLADALQKTPDQLSAGQRQRVAIARGIVHEPLVLLADEPTGNLDSVNASAIADLLTNIAQERQIALVMVTHDPEMAARCQRTLALLDGQNVDEPQAHQGDPR